MRRTYRRADAARTQRRPAPGDGSDRVSRYGLAVATVAFVHAHPDDEAIFSGGTILSLVERGHRVLLLVATGGELGADDGSGALAPERRRELEAAATILGVHEVHHLGHLDSGMAGDPANHAPGSFFAADPHAVAAVVAGIFSHGGVDTVVVYDDHGVYGHPDHVQGHVVGLAAAELAGISCRYEMTVDREYLHFVETHLVEEAALGGDLGLAGSRIGTSSVEIDLTLDVRAHLDPKRRAMAAHRSQLPEHAPVFGLDPDRFAEVYGWEWYRRLGPRGVLDDLVVR
jgi:LmbE family N-acetylglucosaminyl deacetylase